METTVSIDILNKYSKVDEEEVERLLEQEFRKSDRKIVVLDDDPTGVQTVHDVSVYTDWSKESIENGFSETNRLFYILTNSRGFTEAQTENVHKEIAKTVSEVAKACKRDVILVSRSDSTLRGHYPLETTLLKEGMEKTLGISVDGEILCPFFKEGGRFTLENTHYVRYGEELVPAAQTEFAKDATFGYHHSDKHGGKDGRRLSGKRCGLYCALGHPRIKS